MKQNDTGGEKKKITEQRPTNIFTKFFPPGSDTFNQQAQGQIGENETVDKLRKKFENLKLPEETKEIVEKELKSLARLKPWHHEYSNIEHYLDTLSDLPWGKYDEENTDLSNCQKVLDSEHYGLQTVKKRIVEFMAVQGLAENKKGSILCFVGPPGVGKTSIGSSIARAMNRKFYRIALGGVKDESIIRGFKRTYVGSQPGVFIQSLIKVGTSNPVFLLDEIDKLGQDWKGDTQSAMLEVLDPEQNSSFGDNYLGTPFDLSKVFFIATANTLDTIHPALLDRLEVIELSGYSEKEKVNIAEQYLIPKQ